MKSVPDKGSRKCKGSEVRDNKEARVERAEGESSRR